MKKPSIPSVYFVKALCALGIIIYHFMMLMGNLELPWLRTYANGNYGDTFVTVFFAISGFILHYHYGDGLKLKQYYLKRWRGIFPMFYVAYLYYMVQRFFDNRTLFYNGNPLRYLLTLIAMDGYTIPRLESYYILGEWFLGAIVLMYLLYPLVLRFFRKRPMATFAAIVILYGAFYNQPITNANSFWTVSSCLLSFSFGMVCCTRRQLLTSRLSLLLSAAGLLLLQFVPLPSALGNLCAHLHGSFLFVLLMALGEQVMKLPPAGRLFRELGRLSYPIFLVHHQVLQKIAMVWQPQTPWKAAVLLVLAIGLILPWAKVLELVTEAVMKKVDPLLTGKASTTL